MSGFLVWKTPRMEVPECLQGAPIVRVHCDAYDQVALAHHAELLPIASPFVALPGGFGVAKIGQLDPTEYRRQIPWAVALSVVDGFGIEWDVPAILSPEGIPICDRSWMLDESGQWVRKAICDRQERAIAAALASHPHINNVEEYEEQLLLPWACAILECSYHLDAATIGRLGLLTTTSALAIVRGAAGWIPA
jgi:hypothetical protein